MLPAEWEALPLLDEAKLAELALSVGEDMVGVMLAMIPEEAELSVAAIGAAIGAGDLPGMRQAAHALRGVASNFGAARVTALARILEHDVASPLDAVGLVPHLNRAVADTTALIAAR